MINKEYKVYALFRKDYRKSASISYASIVKCVFYGCLCMILLFKFIFSIIASAARTPLKDNSLFYWMT